MIKPMKDFPLLEDYKKVFKIDENTVFAFDNVIYCDKPIPPDIMVHEQAHLRRQNKLGVYKWCEQYIQDKDFRLKEEIIAYKEQINVVKDRELRNQCRMECANNLSSSLYGNLIDYQTAYKLLKC